MMTTKLIILRGPSASGKSTVAKELLESTTRKVAYIEEDNIRRTILQRHDDDRVVQKQIIKDMIQTLFNHGFAVLLEGILNPDRYEELIQELTQSHKGESFLFHFNIELPETLKRHRTKPIKDMVSDDDLKSWYEAGRAYNWPDEIEIKSSSSLEDSLALIKKLTNV